MQLKLGKDISFYLILEEQANVAVRAAEAFRAMTASPNLIDKYATDLNTLEHEGDALTHRLQNQVAATFITPIDKEDLRDLSQKIDDVIDATESAGARMKLYRLTEMRKDVVPLSDLVVSIARKVQESIAELKVSLHSDPLQKKLEDIHKLENDSDELYRRALGDLFFQEGVDPLYVMKWKEIYERIEQTMDTCEDVAKIIGTIVVKYA